MKRFYLILSLVAMLFISCEGGFGEGGNTDFGNITLDENTTELLNQTLESDALSGTGITFTANASWSATVNAVRSGASWLTISPDHGEAGTYTLSITLEANNTGASRCAEIIISCDGSTLKITITQKAAEQVTPPAPTIDAKNRITAIFTRADDDEGYYYRTFYTYNDNGNIASIKYEDISDYKLKGERTQTINYDGRNVTIPEVGYYLNTQEYPQPHSFRVKEEFTKGTAILNSDGTLSSYNYDGEVFNISYGKDGRVDKYTNEQSEAVALFTWEDGNLTSIYTDRLGATVTINYSDKENIYGGVDWLWLLIHNYDYSEEHMVPFAVLNKNGGLHTKNLPQSFSANGITIELTYTFDEQERIESVTFYGVTYIFGYADETFVGYEWAPYVKKQEIVNYYNEVNSGDLGYNRHCVVRTYSGKDNYFDHTYTQAYRLKDIYGDLFIGPEYRYVNVDMKSEDDYTNAKYIGSYTEPYIDEFEREANYVYYDFTTFMARSSYMLELSEEQFSLYDATTGKHVATEFPNEEWVPYFKLVETERSKDGAGEGTDENGVSGKQQYYTIYFDKYVAFSRKDADPTKLNYIMYDSRRFIVMNLWIPDEQ